METIPELDSRNIYSIQELLKFKENDQSFIKPLKIVRI